MIRHNIRQSIRGMLKNKTFTTLNLMGFAIAFAIVITIMLFTYKEYSVNSFIPNSEKVYRLVDTDQNQTLIDNSILPEIKNKYPEIKEVVSIFHLSINEKVINLKKVKSNEHLWVHNIISTNNDFFSLMGIKVLASKTDSPFTDKNSIVLTKSTAIKLFGTTDVIDEYLYFIGQKLYVSAVVEDIPTHATIDADFYCHEDNKDLVTAGSDGTEGHFYMSDIYFSLIADTNVDDLLAKMNQSFPQNKSNTKTISAESVRDIYFSKAIYQMNNDKKGNLFLVWIFIGIAVLTLIMAIFNYVNFTISQQIKTLKNSGIRITNGATRSQIGSYHITNVVLSVGFSFTLAIIISGGTMPLASKLLATELSPLWLLDLKFITLLFALLIFVILICSILPIGFISRLNIQHLFGKSKLKSRKHPLKTIMTVAQVSISMVLVVGFITINKQLKYVKTADVGFDKQRLVQLNLPKEFEKHNVLRNAINKLPFVDALSYTAYAPGGGTSGGYLNKGNGEKIRVRTMYIDEHFIKTFGLKLTHGSEFIENDLNKACYISEAAYKQLNKNIEGKQFGMHSIKGVVNDININSLHSKIIPICYLFIKRYSALNVKLKEGNLKQQLQEIEKIWDTSTNGAIFSYSFYGDYYRSLYKKEDRQAKALTLFAIIAFIITCLGLLSQVLQNTQNRIKEVGIRKINGATIKEVMLLLNKDFLWAVAIAFVIATPIAYYAMNKWLENFAYKTTLSWWIFALAGLSALVIALLTVSWQSYRAASRNPVEALRYE